jgi:hypothetical protein
MQVKYSAWMVHSRRWTSTDDEKLVKPGITKPT